MSEQIELVIAIVLPEFKSYNVMRGSFENKILFRLYSK